MMHKRQEYERVADILEAFVENRGEMWDWDRYISGPYSEDSHLKSIQDRMASLGEEFPPEKKGHYCGSKGIDVIKDCIKDLRLGAINAN